MISNKVSNAIIKASAVENKNKVIEELMKHLNDNYDYDDYKKNHFLEMLTDINTVVKVNDVDIDYIVKNINKFVYNGDKYSYRNIKVKSIDNIDCTIKVSYEYIENINKDKDGAKYSSSDFNINFYDYEVLKKS